MHWDQISGHWKQVIGKTETQWGKLQERYGTAREEAEKQFAAWERQINELWFVKK
jgi:uncharacterized protein YjbJ (UPF0337 family)